MKPFFIGLVIVAAFLAPAEQTNELSTVRRVIEAEPLDGAQPLMLADKFGNTPVLVMEPLRSPSLQELFPSVAVYRLISSRDVLHGVSFSALLVTTNGSPSHLQSDDEVAFFLGRLCKDVVTKQQALRLVRAFADLRSYKIVETAPDFPDVREPKEQPAPADTDYKFVAEERNGEWRVYATFLTSESRGTYSRYVLRILKPPGRALLLADPVEIRLRNYSY